MSTNSRFFSPIRSSSGDRIDGPGEIDRMGRYFAQPKKYRFGVSRKTMKKVYIDEILGKASRNEPGPANYNLSPSFG